MSLFRVLLLTISVACLASLALSFPAEGPARPGKRGPQGVAPQPPAKDLEGSESIGYGWGYGGYGWGGWGGWGYGYPYYGYGWGYGYPYGFYGGYGFGYPYYGGYWW